MSYQSPIELVMGQMNLALEDQICKAVQNVWVNVDKEEMLKALQYDRDQYRKGYDDRDSEIVRCKDCKHKGNPFKCIRELGKYGSHRTNEYDDWFCADGERRDGDDG